MEEDQPSNKTETTTTTDDIAKGTSDSMEKEGENDVEEVKNEIPFEEEDKVDDNNNSSEEIKNESDEDANSVPSSEEDNGELKEKNEVRFGRDEEGNEVEEESGEEAKEEMKEGVSSREEGPVAQNVNDVVEMKEGKVEEQVDEEVKDEGSSSEEVEMDGSPSESEKAVSEEKESSKEAAASTSFTKEQAKDDTEMKAISATSDSLKDDEDNNSTSSTSSSTSSFLSEDEMPLLKYGRIQSSLPRSTSSSTLHPPCHCTALGHGVCTPASTTTTTTTLPSTPTSLLTPDYTAAEIMFFVCAFGFADGTLSLLDAHTGLILGEPLIISNTRIRRPDDRYVVSLDFDSSGKYLVGCRSNGDVAVFEPKYHYSFDHHHAAMNASRFSLWSSSRSNLMSSTAGSNEPRRMLDGDIATSRFSYSNTNFSRPTCLALDPAYARRREKTIAVGFSDGRVVLTKRGTFFGRRNDVVIYSGNAKDERAIQSLSWRGSLIAWADGMGVKLYNVDVGQRVAQIERPSGARVGLFPSVKSLKCHLVFERSDSLLIAWGDCVMAMHVVEKKREGDIVKRVECSMAWELDCVACGVVPMDKHHVGILGLVPCDYEEEKMENVLEMQILSRKCGTVTSSDALVLNCPEGVSVAASGHNLVSSFAVSRMSDDMEAEEGTTQYLSSISMLQLMQQQTGASKKFVDSHIRWSMQSIICNEKTDEDEEEEDPLKFLFEKPLEKQQNQVPISPPIMIINSPYDAILVRTRDVDDAISHAISRENHGLALRRALQNRRMLRRHDIKQVINDYLSSLLRGDDGILTLQKLKRAAMVTPVLLGGDADMWENWMYEFAKIPGGLFALREYLPIRDPKLSRSVYEMALEKMLIEVENIVNEPDAELEDLKEATGLFLDAMRAWGPTMSMKERMDLLRYYTATKSWAKEEMEEKKGLDLELERIGKDLNFRSTQTAAGYLNGEKPSPVIAKAADPIKGGGRVMDSLFDLDQVAMHLIPRLPLVDRQTTQIENTGPGAVVATEAMAEIYFMKEQFDEALKMYLSIGGYFTPSSRQQQLDDDAIQSVNTSTIHSKPHFYQHVLAMIECHYLHHLLLDPDFLPLMNISSTSKTQEPPSPLTSLIQLVGLDQSQAFLVKNCTLPSLQPISTSSPNLPLDTVASQLQHRPKLLHWYLHSIFQKRPELYVSFPTTAVPPKAVTDLHRQHLELYIDYALQENDSTNKEDSPLMSFLKAALPHGGTTSSEVRHLLESKRSSTSKDPKPFSRELAHIIERSSTDDTDNTLEDSKTILKLHLEGENTRSLPLAVSYAMRNQTHSSSLWDYLIRYCLQNTTTTTSSDNQQISLFGPLLETAAQCGADLSNLVSQIPQGMKIEGLRPKLVKAIRDYRLQLKMHEAAVEIMKSDKVGLLRELTHRSRRGVRVGGGGGQRMMMMREGRRRKSSMELKDSDLSLTRSRSLPIV